MILIKGSDVKLRDAWARTNADARLRMVELRETDKRSQDKDDGAGKSLDKDDNTKGSSETKAMRPGRRNFQSKNQRKLQRKEI